MGGGDYNQRQPVFRRSSTHRGGLRFANPPYAYCSVRLLPCSHRPGWPFLHPPVTLPPPFLRSRLPHGSPQGHLSPARDD